MSGAISAVRWCACCGELLPAAWPWTMCVGCSVKVCAVGNGQAARLPPPGDLDRAVRALERHVAACARPDRSGCPVCAFASVTCPECGDVSDAMGDDASLHGFLDEWVIVGCEGYVTPIVRAAAALAAGRWAGLVLPVRSWRAAVVRRWLHAAHR